MKILAVLVFVGLVACRQKELFFLPLSLHEKVDSSIARSSRVQYFIVRGFSNDKECLRQVDAFAEKSKSSDYANFPQYEIVFYKESDQTNLNNIAKDPRVIDRYSQEHDEVLSYKWSNGKFISRQTIKDGMPQEGTDKIEVKDLQKQ